MLNTQLLALSLQISNVTTYPGDKREEQPAPEPQHTQDLLMGVCFMEEFPVVGRWLCEQQRRQENAPRQSLDLSGSRGPCTVGGDNQLPQIAL